MQASLFKRVSSSLIDLVIVLIVVYGVFFLGGQSLLQGRIENYNTLNADYTEIMEVYNTDLEEVESDYNVAMTLAGEDEALKETAREEYRLKQNILLSQNTSDIIPYNTPLTSLIVYTINFFVIGFVILMNILSVATVGRTPGRRLLKVNLMGRNKEDQLVKPKIWAVFLHDSILKYVIIGGLIVYNLPIGIMALAIGFILDVILITFTRNGSTIRDFASGLKVYSNT